MSVLSLPHHDAVVQSLPLLSWGRSSSLSARCRSWQLAVLLLLLTPVP